MIYCCGIAHTLAEAERTYEALGRQIEAARDALAGPYVQVEYIGGGGGSAWTVERIGGGGSAWTYTDPSGTLKVGDTVEVDARGHRKLAIVVELGRGAGSPRDCKPVLAVYRKDVL